MSETPVSRGGELSDDEKRAALGTVHGPVWDILKAVPLHDLGMAIDPPELRNPLTARPGCSVGCACHNAWDAGLQWRAECVDDPGIWCRGLTLHPDTRICLRVGNLWGLTTDLKVQLLRFGPSGVLHQATVDLVQEFELSMAPAVTFHPRLGNLEILRYRRGDDTAPGAKGKRLLLAAVLMQLGNLSLQRVPGDPSDRVEIVFRLTLTAFGTGIPDPVYRFVGRGGIMFENFAQFLR